MVKELVTESEKMEQNEHEGQQEMRWRGKNIRKERMGKKNLDVNLVRKKTELEREKR